MKVSAVSDKEARDFLVAVLKEYAKPGKKKVMGELVDYMLSLKKGDEEYSESDKKAIMEKGKGYLTDEGLECLEDF